MNNLVRPLTEEEKRLIAEEDAALPIWEELFIIHLPDGYQPEVVHIGEGQWSICKAKTEDIERVIDKQIRKIEDGN